MNRTSLARFIFITGTDHGVGKTLPTGLLLRHKRQSGCHALAMKHSWSGSRAVTKSLYAVQEGELTSDEITPFLFAETLPALVAARRCRLPFRWPEDFRQIRLHPTLLTVEAVKTIENKGREAVLMSHNNANCSTHSNRRILSQLLTSAPVLWRNFQGGNLRRF